MYRVAAKVSGYVYGASRIQKHTVVEIRRSQAFVVNSFVDLTRRIAYITYNNPQHHMYFRGQSSDHAETSKGSSLYPSIFRGKGGPAKSLKAKFTKLRLAEDLLLRKTNSMNFTGKQKLLDFQELRWAILQHYRVCETPLLDVTSSLRIAVSFALTKESGYLYVLGLPAVDSSITYSVEERLLNIQLSRICPPRAYRPFFQEAFLLGDYPKPDKKSTSLDFSRRLITKFRLFKLPSSSKSFPVIEQDYLFPDEKDVFYKICESIKDSIA